MSQYPPAGPTFDYQAYAPVPRPPAVTALAILAIIFGSMGLLCNAMGLVGQVAFLLMHGKNPFAPDQPLPTTHALTIYGVIASVIGLALSAVLLGGGIGGLRLAPAARRILIVWSIVTIVWATINVGLQLGWALPEARRLVQNSPHAQSQLSPQVVQQISSASQTVGVILGWVFWCVLPILFLTLWRTAPVTAAFGAPTAPDTPPPAPMPRI